MSVLALFPYLAVQDESRPHRPAGLGVQQVHASLGILKQLAGASYLELHERLPALVHDAVLHQPAGAAQQLRLFDAKLHGVSGGGSGTRKGDQQGG